MSPSTRVRSYPRSSASARHVSRASRLAWMSVRTRYLINARMHQWTNAKRREGGNANRALCHFCIRALRLPFQEIQELLDQRVDTLTAGIDPDVRLLVG